MAIVKQSPLMSTVDSSARSRSFPMHWQPQTPTWVDKPAQVVGGRQRGCWKVQMGGGTGWAKQDNDRDGEEDGSSPRGRRDRWWQHMLNPESSFLDRLRGRCRLVPVIDAVEACRCSSITMQQFRQDWAVRTHTHTPLWSCWLLFLQEQPPGEKLQAFSVCWITSSTPVQQIAQL